MWEQMPQGESARKRKSEKEYIEITESDIWNFIVNSDWYFDQVDLNNVDEMVFDIKYTGKYSPIDDPIAIRWYTTVDNRTGKSRPRGWDAMRLSIVHLPTGRPINRAPRTYRIPTWEKNIEEKIQNLRDQFYNLPMCPECGNVLIIVEAKSGKEFRGCSNYFPNKECRYSEKL